MEGAEKMCCRRASGHGNDETSPVSGQRDVRQITGTAALQIHMERTVRRTLSLKNSFLDTSAHSKSATDGIGVQVTSR
jgi:hypothetical protein